MKSLKTVLSLLLVTILISSCTNDDPLARVKYTINGYDSYITQIKYDVIGGTVNVEQPDDFGNGSDSRSLSINILPFDAKLEVSVNNPTTTNKIYNLIIYVDGVAKATYDLNVAASSSAIGEVAYTVEAD